MKRTIFILALLVGLASCDEASSRPEKLKAIQKVFPHSRVFYSATGSGSLFFVVDSLNQIYEVETNIDVANWQLANIQKLIEVK